MDWMVFFPYAPSGFGVGVGCINKFSQGISFGALGFVKDPPNFY